MKRDKYRSKYNGDKMGRLVGRKVGQRQIPITEVDEDRQRKRDGETDVHNVRRDKKELKIDNGHGEVKAGNRHERQKDRRIDTRDGDEKEQTWEGLAGRR